MQLCVAHLLAVFNFRYLQNSASSGPKTSLLDQKWLYFWSCLLSFKDIEHWRLPKDAPCNAAYFTYQAVNILFNIGGLNWGNRLAETGTEPAGPGFSWNRYCRNGPKMEPLVRLIMQDEELLTLHWRSFVGGSCDIVTSIFAHEGSRWVDYGLTPFCSP